MYMKVLNILILALVLSTILIPVAANFLTDVVLPAVGNLGKFILNLGGDFGLMGGGGGDEIDGEPYPT